MQTIYLEPAQVPAALRGRYDGKKFAARVCESVTIPADAGTWMGGSRSTYSAVYLETGDARQACDTMSAPWDASRGDCTVAMRPGFAIVRHSISCGKDMGLTLYLHPENAAALLPAPVELTALERLVLKYTKERKSSYNGRNRYEMAAEDWRWSQRGAEPWPYTADDWEDAKRALAARGLLNKAGAITPAGRNAVTEA